MIEARLELHAGTLKQLGSKLLSLLAELRPSHHSLGEDEAGQLIGDPKGFVDSLTNRSPGPWLTGKFCSYDISLAGPKEIICFASLEVSSTLAEQFMVEMASLNPVFGSACVQDERIQRNRIAISLGSNNIESWVGRDTQKYIPGLYWLTLLPDALMKRNGMVFSATSWRRSHVSTLSLKLGSTCSASMRGQRIGGRRPPSRI